jgi:hypothetical protein
MTCSLSVILLTGLLLIITTTGTILVNTAFGQFGGRFSGGFVPIEEKVLPTYVIRIPPGSSQKDSPQHYYPPNIAIPAGTTQQRLQSQWFH